MEAIIKKNEKCFIGMPACGYVYESAKLCFVACPSHEKYTLKIEVIKDLVETLQYECHVALKRIDPGTFAFCTKICSKIIQSQFCIVFLDPSLDKNNAEYPNPNVHFEYGMMIRSYLKNNSRHKVLNMQYNGDGTYKRTMEPDRAVGYTPNN